MHLKPSYDALVKRQPEENIRRIDTVMHNTKWLVEIDDVNFVNLKGDFEL